MRSANRHRADLCNPGCAVHPKEDPMETWPFTSEVATGGWHVSGGDVPGFGRPHYWLDPDYHAIETDAQITANANLIAAAPWMYRVLARLAALRSLPFSAEAVEIVAWIEGRS